MSVDRRVASLPLVESPQDAAGLRGMEHETPWLLLLDDAAVRRLSIMDPEPIDRALRALAGRPGIAALNVAVAGLAAELAVHADIVVAHPRVSLRGGCGRSHRLAATPWRLAGRCGSARALSFWLDERPWKARRAGAAGLIDRLTAAPVEAARTIRDRWLAGGAAASSLCLLRRCNPALGEAQARALERALFSLTFADEQPRLRAREFFSGRRSTTP